MPRYPVYDRDLLIHPFIRSFISVNVFITRILLMSAFFLFSLKMIQRLPPLLDQLLIEGLEISRILNSTVLQKAPLLLRSLRLAMDPWSVGSRLAPRPALFFYWSPDFGTRLHAHTHTRSAWLDKRINIDNYSRIEID